MTPTDQLSPDTLEKYFRSGTMTTHHVNDSPEVIITIDGPGQKISVLYRSTTAAASNCSNVRSSPR